MGALKARTCVACSNPVESLLNGDILCNDCLAFQMSTVPQIPVTKPCPMCDTDMPVLRDLCDECIDTLKDSSILKRRRTDTLKLYKVYVYDPPTGTGVVRKNAVMYVLGKSEPSTVESVQEWLREELDDWTHKTQVTSIKELEGPFNHGHVIYFGVTEK